METRTYFDVTSLKSLPGQTRDAVMLLRTEGLNENTITQTEEVDFEAIVPKGKFFVMDSVG